MGIWITRFVQIFWILVPFCQQFANCSGMRIKAVTRPKFRADLVYARREIRLFNL